MLALAVLIASRTDKCVGAGVGYQTEIRLTRRLSTLWPERKQLDDIKRAAAHRGWPFVFAFPSSK